MTATDIDFVLTRVFDAPRPLVWQAWTEPERLGRWFGPRGSRTQVLRMALKPGGSLHARIDSPAGQTLWAYFLYREVVPPERLVWEHSFADEHGHIVRSPFGGDWPLRLLTTVTFAEQGARTEVTLRWTPLEATEAERRAFADSKPSMRNGWGGSYEVLDAYLAGLG